MSKRNHEDQMHSVCKRIRHLPDCLYDVICNDYLGHHLYRIDLHTIQHAIKIHYDAIDPYISGKNGCVVYNTDIDGLVYAVLQSAELFHKMVALIGKVHCYGARIQSIRAGDIMRFYNGITVYGHLVTSHDAMYVYTIPIAIYNYGTSDVFYREKKRSTMAIEKDYLKGMVSFDVFTM
jgi:hypothetical protein